jgi:7,8-dihydropterin-6-yl-methyl-4-(beta-D-ribofuranosyl)aminobenzene 5'-phosphate synthase
MKKIMCMIDNAVQHASPYWGEHGLSFLIETEDGCLLFDTGGSEAVLWHNLALLGGSLSDISVLALSHAHYDHTGALIPLLSQKVSLPVYAHPDLFRQRFALKEGKYKAIGLPVSQAELDQLADLHLSDVPIQVLPGLWTSGEITERHEPEGRSRYHVVRANDDWQPDPYRDDMSMVLETHQGLVVVCGCCHAGLLNTLAHIRHTFERPIIAIVGGTHLVAADEGHLTHIIETLRDTYGAPQLYLNHCTGQRAYAALANAFRDQVNPCPAGTTLAFS